MRFLAILLLVTLAFSSAVALKKRQTQQGQHAGYCPMHRFICAIACPNRPVDLEAPKPINGCTSDGHCASDEKCCRPACGCTNKCVKALETPGFDKSG